MKQFIYCQSCGMPLKKDPEHGGTEKDGTKGVMYCSYCVLLNHQDNFMPEIRWN